MAQRKTARTTSTKRRTSSSTSKKATASRKAKAGVAKSSSGDAAATNVGDQEVTIDRRRAHLRQNGGSAEAAAAALQPKLERRKKVNRRRQIDPTTCERDYSGDEIEFMNALDDYKRKSGRMFPTCSEVLEVVRSLGYVKALGTERATGQFGGTTVHPASTDWFANSKVAAAESNEEKMLEAALAE